MNALKLQHDNDPDLSSISDLGATPCVAQDRTRMLETRREIDRVDELLVELLSTRLELTRSLASLKSHQRLPVRDCEREREVLARVTSIASSECAPAIQSIFRTIIEESVQLQQQETLALKPITPTPFKRIFIFGLGLIGGAFARQIRNLIPDAHITAVDPHAPLDKAISQSVIHQIGDDDALAAADLILLCAPPTENMKLLESIATTLRPHQVVVDVSSVKRPITNLAQQLGLGKQFIGGHPFFGTEKQGFENSEEVLCDGSTFVLTPTENTPIETLNKLESFLSSMNLSVRLMTAAEHDATVARTSHMLQLISIAVGNSLVTGRSESDLGALLSISGGAMKNNARLMSSPAALWNDIMSQNCDELQDAVGSLRQSIDSICDAIGSADQRSFAEQFRNAALVRQTLERVKAS